VKSLAGADYKVVNPFGAVEDVQVRDLSTGGIVASASQAKSDQTIEFKTENDHLYVVERKAQPLEKAPLIGRKP
jgi:hypothetical protein